MARKATHKKYDPTKVKHDYKKKKPTLKKLAKRVAKLEDGPEIKQFSIFASAGSAVTTTPDPRSSLHNISRGTSAKQRIGDFVKIKSLTYRCMLEWQNSLILTDYPSNVLRATLVYDKSNNGSASPDITNLYEDINHTLYSGWNIEYKDRFTIYKDQYINMGSGSSGSTVDTPGGTNNGTTMYLVDWTIKPNFNITYKADTASWSDLVNAFYVILVAKYPNNITIVDEYFEVLYTDC